MLITIDIEEDFNFLVSDIDLYYSYQLPKIKKYIAISAPHTSNWDFLIGRCFAYISNLQPKYLIKSELYFWPLSILIKWNGGIPVYRKTAKNTVDQVVERLKAADNLILGIAPEGTRKKPGEDPDYKPGVAGIYKELNTNVIPVALNSEI